MLGLIFGKHFLNLTFYEKIDYLNSVGIKAQCFRENRFFSLCNLTFPPSSIKISEHRTHTNTAIQKLLLYVIVRT